MRLVLGRLVPSLAVLALTLLALLLAPTAPAKAAVDWSAPGPHRVSVQLNGGTKLFYPSDIADGTRKHPVLIWGNGTFAVPVVYDGLLRHWASHGFVVAAAVTPFANTGLEMRAGIDLLGRLNAQPGSPFHGRVDLARVGSAGHSQGGAGAVNAAADPRVTTTVALQPGPLAATSVLHGPTLFLAGQHDTIVLPPLVRALYNGSTHVPAVYTELAGATHFTPIGDGGGYRGLTTAWFRFHLMDDGRARSLFFGPDCGICSGGTWLNTMRNAKAQEMVQEVLGSDAR